MLVVEEARLAPRQWVAALDPTLLVLVVADPSLPPGAEPSTLLLAVVAALAAVASPPLLPACSPPPCVSERRSLARGPPRTLAPA